jgi:hypothetical protein
MVPSAQPDWILELFLSIILGQDYQAQQKIDPLSVPRKEAQDRKKKLSFLQLCYSRLVHKDPWGAQ